MPTVLREKQASQSSTPQINPRSARLLLALWFLGGKNVSQGEVTKRIKLKEEKSADCQKFFTQLENHKAIEVIGKKVSITDTGKSMLNQGLQSTDLDVKGTIAGSWMVKALLTWIQQSEVVVNGAASNGKPAQSAIASYEEFKPEALALFEKLDKGYNYAGLVPIWHLRRELGDRVGREEFSDWVMEMQAEQLFYLQSGEAIGATDDQKQDSISSEIRGLLFYISQPLQ